jgi:hypothetical protein
MKWPVGVLPGVFIGISQRRNNIFLLGNNFPYLSDPF